MRNFYTRNTIEAPNYCPICHKTTQWTISGGRPLYCILCHLKPPVVVEKPEIKIEQPGLFDQ